MNYFINLLKLLICQRMLRPLVVAYAVTTQCNLNCVYCEDFGARRNAQQPPPLKLDDAQHVLRIIRQASSALLITGGEPLLYPDIATLLAYARETLHFRHITLLSNAVLLRQHWAVLPYLDRLMVSVDATSPFVFNTTSSSLFPHSRPTTGRTMIC